MVEADLGEGPCMVGINTNHPNKLVAEAIEGGLVEALGGYPTLRREVKYGKNSRIDILLECPTRGLCYVEVKNVHMMRTAGRAEFPDSVTERGAKHLAEMADMVREGHRAVMVYLVQRPDARSFSLAGDVDQGYVDAFAAAKKAGVEALALRCRVGPEEIAVDGTVPIVI
jgi:sugar fermentation stimulation protein A